MYKYQKNNNNILTHTHSSIELGKALAETCSSIHLVLFCIDVKGLFLKQTEIISKLMKFGIEKG